MRNYLLLFAGILTLANVSTYGEVYKTTDKNGRTVYTDQPAASDTKAKIVTLPNINELPSVTPTTVLTDPSPPIPDTTYHLEITSPASGTRLQPNERDLTISISSDHGLQQGHFFVYYLNGKKVEETEEQTITINEPPRGENKVYVEVLDKYGKRFGQSDSIIVYVMRPIVKH